MEEHAPPPPYSETDTHSSSNGTSNRDRVTHATSPNHAPIALGGISEYAPSSTADSVIYTPPHTPERSLSNHDSVSEGQMSKSASSAAAYFESRPATKPLSGKLILHTVILMPKSTVEDVPYPEPEDTWLSRDVTRQDWATFVNFLLPHHSDVSNAEVADRKMNAEVVEDKMLRLNLNNQSRSRPDIVNAQLDPLRRSKSQELDAYELQSMILQWNDGFFAPRGIQIQLSIPHPMDESAREVPGAWPDGTSETGSASSAPAEYGGIFAGRTLGSSGSWIRAGNDGLHVRGLISADKEGLRVFGRRGIVADKAGFRIGNLLHLGNQGIKIGPHVLENSSSSLRAPPPPAAPPVPYGLSVPPVPSAPAVPQASRGRSLNDQRSPNKSRDRSASTSSHSSVSSDSSVSSIGSLPDYDRLKDNQLPIVKQSLTQWLNNPNQQVTRDSMKQLQRDMREAKQFQSPSSSVEVKALRSDVKGLMKDFRDLKRNQKHQRRAWKRERRAVKRQQKRERRSLRREAKIQRKAFKGKGRAIGGYQTPPFVTMPVPTRGSLGPPEMGGPASGANYQQPNTSSAYRARDLPSNDGNRIQAEAQRIMNDAQKKMEDAQSLREQAEMMPRDDKGRLKLMDIVERMEEEAATLQREAERLMSEAFQTDQEYEERRVDHSRSHSSGQQESGVIRG